MPIRNGYYVLAQQLRGEIIRAPNTTKKFNELRFVSSLVMKVFQSGGFFVFSPVTISFSLQPLRFCSIDFMELSRYMSVLKIISDFLTTISNSLTQMSLSDSKKPHCYPLSLVSYHLEEVEHPPHL